MGSLGAAGFAEQVAEGNASLRTALSWHLTSNHFPPLPTFFIPVAERAIELAQDEEWDELVELPKACHEHEVILVDDETKAGHADCTLEDVVQWRGREDGKVRVSDVVESFHLDSFL